MNQEQAERRVEELLASEKIEKGHAEQNPDGNWSVRYQKSTPDGHVTGTADYVGK